LEEKVFYRISVIAVLILLCFVVACGKKGGESNVNNMASDFIQKLVDHEFMSAVGDFDSTMTAQLPPQRLQEVWSTVLNQYGAFQKQVDSHVEISPFYTRINNICQFERGSLNIRIVFDKEKRIAGLFFIPAEAQVEYEFEAPQYADTNVFTEKQLTVGKGEWTLPATLSLPRGDGPFTAVVLVHGSGPQDRDETIAGNKPFRDIAWGLATRGIAVLRYEKRTQQYNDRMAEIKKDITPDQETVDDALQAVALLRTLDYIDKDRIFVLGHSLGGEMVPRIGERDNDIAGFIIMAGAARPLEDVLLDQFNYLYSLDGVVSDSEQVELDKLKEQIARVKSPTLSDTVSGDELPLKIPATYWLYLKEYHPATEAKKLDQPILILQGGRDYQVTTADYDVWKKALGGQSNVEFKLYPKLNHLFMAGEAKSSPKEYLVPGHVDLRVIQDIDSWINRN
jgi:dienelactone hydrolase